MSAYKQAAELNATNIGQGIRFINSRGIIPYEVTMELRQINHNGAETVLDGYIIDGDNLVTGTELEQFLISPSAQVIIYDI